MAQSPFAFWHAASPDDPENDDHITSKWWRDRLPDSVTGTIENTGKSWRDFKQELSTHRLPPVPNEVKDFFSDVGSRVRTGFNRLTTLDDPNLEYGTGPVTPVARDKTTGEVVGPVLPNVLRSPMLALKAIGSGDKWWENGGNSDVGNLLLAGAGAGGMRVPYSSNSLRPPPVAPAVAPEVAPVMPKISIPDTAVSTQRNFLMTPDSPVETTKPRLAWSNPDKDAGVANDNTPIGERQPTHYHIGEDGVPNSVIMTGEPQLAEDGVSHYPVRSTTTGRGDMADEFHLYPRAANDGSSTYPMSLGEYSTWKDMLPPLTDRAYNNLLDRTTNHDPNPTLVSNPVGDRKTSTHSFTTPDGLTYYGTPTGKFAGDMVHMSTTEGDRYLPADLTRPLPTHAQDPYLVHTGATTSAGNLTMDDGVLHYAINNDPAANVRYTVGADGMPSVSEVNMGSQHGKATPTIIADALRARSIHKPPGLSVPLADVDRQIMEGANKSGGFKGAEADPNGTATAGLLHVIGRRFGGKAGPVKIVTNGDRQYMQTEFTYPSE